MVAIQVQISHACPGTSRVEHVEKLGFGFRILTIAEPVAIELESVGHFEYLYYLDQRLCDLESCSVSPSGDYVIFQEGSSGCLFVYRRADGRRAKLTSRFIALSKGFEWHEDAGHVEVHFTTGLTRSYAIGPETHWSWFF